MLRHNETKSETIKIRAGISTKALIAKAALYAGQDESNFVRSTLVEKANAVIAEHEQTRLTGQDWQRFFALMENPPAPTKRMKQAAEQYKAITGSHAV